MYERKIIKTALVSRLYIIVLQCLFNNIIEDHKNDGFENLAETKGFADEVIDFLFGGFLRWDGKYFMQIARYGYSYENSLAFFPLFPKSVQFMAGSMRSCFPCLNFDSILLIVFVSFNTVLLTLAAVTLYKLTSIVFYPTFGFKVAVLFIYNPASIFFTAPYSEALFSYLTFKSILNCLTLYQKYASEQSLQVSDVKYVLPIALSTCARANGTLNIGFLLYTIVCIYLYRTRLNGSFKRLVKGLMFLIISVALACICLIPFVMFQMYSYNQFCTDFENRLPQAILSYAEEKGYILPGEYSKWKQPWCSQNLPLAYAHVQEHYWNVGWFKYYEWKQLPNFIISFPILSLLLWNCSKYFAKNYPRKLKDLFTLNQIYEERKFSPKKTLFGPTVLVFIAHASFLTVFCITCVHIQVSTRLLSSSTPLVYWLSAYYLPNTFSVKSLFFGPFYCHYEHLSERLMNLYYIIYFITGIVLFCNGFPWT